MRRGERRRESTAGRERETEKGEVWRRDRERQREAERVRERERSTHRHSASRWSFIDTGRGERSGFSCAFA